MNAREILQDKQAIKKEFPDAIEITPLQEDHYYEVKHSLVTTPIGQMLDSTEVFVTANRTIVPLPQ